MKDKKMILFQKRKENILKIILPYFITGIFTAVTLLVMLYTLKIYPFGDKTYLWADADQYLGIESFFGSLLGKNDIFYSWGNVLGGNALVELAYYSFSPFNVIYIIFHNHLLFAAHLVVYIKIIMTSLTFCYCLLSIYDKTDLLLKSILSTCYAFMGYMVFYGWNTSWMDGVILLPIMYVGIKKIIEGKNILQYVFSLSIAIIVNFYIGFMLCIGSFIFYIAQLLLSTEEFTNTLKKTFIKYSFSSLVSVGISAFLLIPTYLGLPSNRSLTLIDMFKSMNLVAKPAEILSGLFTGQINSFDQNAPLIYVGIFVIVLDILFFVNQKNPFKKKAIFSVLIFIFVISFENSFINQVWHGLSNNVWFNYRYSFILSFLLLIISCETYELLKKGMISKKDILKSVLILGIILIFVSQNASDKINMHGICFDIVLIVIILTVVFTKKQYIKKSSAVILACCIVLSLAYNGYFYLKDTDMQSSNTYWSNKSLIQNATALINDDSFYRMDKSFSQGRCDSNLFNYKGISNYASTENLENLEYLKRLGVSHSWMWATYTTNLPVATESLLGFKYVLANTDNAKGYEIIGKSGDITYFKNQYALPILFPVNNLENYNLNELNDFDLLNKMWKSINGLDENIFTPCTLVNISSKEENRLNFTIESTGSVYLLIPSGSYTSINITGSGLQKDIDYDYSSEIYYIGEFNEGDSLEISFTTTDENFDLNSISCYIENSNIVFDNSQLVNNQNISIEELSSSHLVMTYSGEKYNIATTIPYDKGWKVYDNGKELTTTKNWNNFLSFQLTPTKKHHIELLYRPIGFSIGCKITFFSIVLLFLFEFLNSNIMQKHIKCKTKHTHRKSK